MTIEKAVDVLMTNYGRAIGNPTIKDPVAWALYKTWRKADSEKKQGNKKNTFKSKKIY